MGVQWSEASQFSGKKWAVIITTSTKGIMDMEGARSLTYFLYAYGKPRLSPVHKYSSLRSTAHRATVAAGRCRDPEGSARNSCNSWPLYAR